MVCVEPGEKLESLEKENDIFYIKLSSYWSIERERLWLEHLSFSDREICFNHSLLHFHFTFCPVFPPLSFFLKKTTTTEEEEREGKVVISLLNYKMRKTISPRDFFHSFIHAYKMIKNSLIARISRTMPISASDSLEDTLSIFFIKTKAICV